jgi:hypothetical protein
MKTFTQYDPRKPLPRQQLLKKYAKPMEGNNTDFYFLRDGDHFLIYHEHVHTYPVTSSTRPGESRLIANQFEMPLSGVRWFINAIEQKFFKSPEEGGLPADKISFKETVDGEDLHIIRSMHAGCQHPGYKITNSSRRSHFSSDDLQTLAMADPWLFNDGLMDFLKEIADRYEQGTL